MTSLQKLALLSLLGCIPAFAQKYTAAKIVFKNHGAFPQAQLEKAAGLHPGSHFTVDDLSAAAQKLSDTAYFDNVGAAVEGPATGMTILFDLKLSDPAQFLPLGFENFVWLTPAEIDATLREQLPLYNGTLPETGPQLDTAVAELTTALGKKGLTAKVVHETVEPTLQHPARVIELRIATPAVFVSNIKIGGVKPDLAPLLQASAKGTAGHVYNDGLAGNVSSDTLLAPIRDAGYAKASLGELTFDPPTETDGKVPLVLHAQLATGDIYKIAAIHFPGAPLYSADDFAKTLKLHPGDLAAQNKLLESLAPIDAAYRSKGYSDVIVAAKPTFDDDAKTVTYAVTVTPGEIYRIKTVTPQGLDPRAQADFDKYFLMRDGAPFNPTYTNDFVKNNSALSSLTPYTGAWKATSNPTTHTVDLAITFFRGNSLQQKVVVH